MRSIEGVVTALATPFRGGQVDYEAFRKLVSRQVEAGVDWLLVAGTTGEGATLTLDEKRGLLETALEVADAGCGVMVGVSVMASAEAVSQTEALVAAGAQAILSVVPPYVKPPDEGLLDHFLSVAQAAGGTPVVLYNVPGRTGLDVAPEVFAKAASSAENIVAVKEASPDILKISRIRTAAPHLAILSGNDAATLPAICLGACGVVSVAANLAPRHLLELVAAARNGDIETARTLHQRLLPLFDALFMETNPVPLKAGLKLLAMAEDEVRAPLSPPSPETFHTMQSVLMELKLL